MTNFQLTLQSVEHLKILGGREKLINKKKENLSKRKTFLMYSSLILTNSLAIYSFHLSTLPSLI